ncbi:unnamed protein product (macronuclear) [Paramecium tetraurelia]|uniref:Uncharacterized protein n=1 Tax=Paramecium tetraurelia TaxID=5888 RepID=A0EHM5_PARTE|nr:uncharacterized protein GSPATT00027142001 [Paramecium tetraurelia]CAK94816.1 unnamed protein product [Paramecium tetraurelia]|eukprot:XP_001462189.1 hypothetical protein (macronuclear) [Paramecium tetraurelia strain d4-2]
MQLLSRNILKRFTNVPFLCFSSKKDLYELLGVPKNASQNDIKNAYYGLAKKYHPDANPSKDAKEKFAEINNAYETLSDENKRKVYDQAGAQDPFAAYRGKAQDFQFDESIFGDFASFFNMGGESERQIKGADIFIQLEISFMDSVNGAQQTIQFEKIGVCSTCNGTKCKPGTAPGRCTNCGGRGSINYRQGAMTIQMACTKCRGTGVSIKNPCTTCKGAGIQKQATSEAVNIPKGIADGQNLRVTGKGNIGENGGKAGDLIIKVQVKPDSYYKRDGYDLITNAYISVAQAVLGDQVKIKTLNGEQQISIKPGSQDGEKIRLSGLGITKLAPNSNQRGDQVVNLKIQIPTNLNEQQRKLFEELAKLEKSETKGQSTVHEGVFEKVKNIFNK